MKYLCYLCKQEPGLLATDEDGVSAYCHSCTKPGWNNVRTSYRDDVFEYVSLTLDCGYALWHPEFVRIYVRQESGYKRIKLPAMEPAKLYDKIKLYSVFS